MNPQTSTKAWAAALGTLAVTLVFQWSGLGEMPAPTDFNDAVRAVVSSGAMALVAGLGTYFAPRNVDK